MKKIIIGILSCEAYRHKADMIRRTWLNQTLPENLTAYFLVGRQEREAEICGDMLYLDCGDFYGMHSKKNIEIFRICAYAF